MGRAKIRKARKQAAFEARRRGISLDYAKKALKVGWLKLPDAIRSALIMRSTEGGKAVGIVTGWSVGSVNQSQNRWNLPGGAALPSSKDGWIVGVDPGFPGKDFTARQSMPRAGRGPARLLRYTDDLLYIRGDSELRTKSSMALQALLVKTKEGHTLTIPSLELSPSIIQEQVKNALALDIENEATRALRFADHLSLTAPTPKDPPQAALTKEMLLQLVRDWEATGGKAIAFDSLPNVLDNPQQ